MAKGSLKSILLRPKFIIGFIFLVIFIFVLLQNREPVSLHFFIWTTQFIATSTIILVSFILGAIISGIVVYFKFGRKKS